MSQKERYERQLNNARAMSESLLADFKTPEQWTQQVHPQCNHALWFAGHMAIVDNFLTSLVQPEKAIDLSKLQPLFGMGSHPTSNPTDYPPVEEVLAIMRERRQVLMQALASLTDDDLTNPLPKGTPDFLSDVGSVFEMAVWHEGLHSGQLSVTRRVQGHEPLMTN